MAFHLFQISELFSNADGSIQFIELRGLAGGQNFLGGHTLEVTHGIHRSVFTFPTDLPAGNTSGARVLIATQGFADLGLISPDYIVPNGFLLLGNGAVNFAEGADRLSYTDLPTDGTNSFLANGSTAPSQAQNFAGDSANIVLFSNGPPALSEPLADLGALAGTAFEHTLPADAFTDPDGDNLSYLAIRSDGAALPGWLTVDPGTGRLSGTADRGDVGILEIRITASDGNGGEASDTFTLTVQGGLELIGSGAADTLGGTTFDDLIDGAAGNDRISGGGGDDELSGGDGADTAVFSGLAGDYLISATDTRLVISDLDAEDGDDGTDQLDGFEFLQFADRLMGPGFLATTAREEADTGDAGNSLESAFDLGTAGNTAMVGAIGEGDGEDWFVFAPGSDSILSASISSADGAAPELEIYNGAGVLVASTGTALPGTAELRIHLDANTSAYARVSDADELARNYTLMLSTQSLLLDADGSLHNSRIREFDGDVIDATAAQVFRQYLGGLGREPGAASGFSFWLDPVTEGARNMTATARGFINTPEFVTKADTDRDGTVTEEEFVDHMFFNVFGRAPTVGGRNFWLNSIDRSSQEQTFTNMLQSPEFVEKTAMTVSDWPLWDAIA